MLRLRTMPPAALAGGESASTWPADDLGRRLDAELLPRGQRVGCIVPAPLARYVLVPWNADMQSAARRQVFAEHCMRETFADLALGWRVRVDAPAYGQATIACAIDGALLDALEAATAQRGLVLCSVQSALMHAANAVAGEFAQGGHWLVVAEAPALTLLFVRDGVPCRVRVRAGSTAQLDTLLAREALMLGDEVVASQVHVVVVDAHADAPGVTVAA